MRPAFEVLRDFEADYEIEIDPPHRIRKIGSNRFVNGGIDLRSGYRRIK